MFFISFFFALQSFAQQQLVWEAKFTGDESFNAANWTFEEGFVRNEEFQWYTKNNIFIKNSTLVIEGRRERIKNPSTS